ncbi:hypothetical protein [Providencia burhodogranariea]|uniref:Preprotein translocase subunit SecD n=1 Tax=Providencia burhodogranariea DSM 19968 TaxID=1141662 RepID=K8VXI7_9GAMM|nr:hypothetical protein [Providencia burhodogranariea]EKT52933.1 hypothetical protein OOA_19444 [Providencia burhodogranariea DSM 19968]
MKAQDLLPDNVNKGHFNNIEVRKGTVGAFLINAKVWLDSTSSTIQRHEAEQDIIEAIPALRALGLFDILDVREHALKALIQSQ